MSNSKNIKKVLFQIEKTALLIVFGILILNIVGNGLGMVLAQSTSIDYFIKQLIFNITVFAFVYLIIDAINQVMTEIGLNPYNNITVDKMTGNVNFLLHVKKTTNVFLLQNTKYTSGYVRFEMTRNDREVVEYYVLNRDSFINKVIELSEGTYYCNISRDITKGKENFRFYFDKRFITQKYLKNDSYTQNLD